MNNLAKFIKSYGGVLFGVVLIALIVSIRVSCSRLSKNVFEIAIPGAVDSLQPFNDINAFEMTSNIKIGWNLGNTLDAHGERDGFPWLGGGLYAYTKVFEMESAWGNPAATEELFVAVKESGFNTIRIPVTWYKAMDQNHNIRTDWMTRVVEVVNYAINNDLYVILNSHHDEEIFKFTNAQTRESLVAFKKLWDQIARVFKNYDERLIFEALNEPRTKGSPHEWTGGTAEEHLNLNKYYQTFVDTVRVTGGNNDKRILIINTYAASAEQTAMDGLVLPADTAVNRLIVSIHAYTPYDFALNKNDSFNSWSKDNIGDTSPITDMFERAYNSFIAKGIPVVMGEFGAMNKGNAAARTEWAEFYVKTAMEKGIPCIWWDNGITSGNGERFGIIGRYIQDKPFPDIIEGLMRGASEWYNKREGRL
ncbi:MAG: glycoside hydrolase family 5 protein [Treponema sp.]|nr:glycoside hydrolase family 5 protein [Treponema sp.]MCL2237218.1 glycoside hydrolase family 5 protein [Treponema sp.]